MSATIAAGPAPLPELPERTPARRIFDWSKQPGTQQGLSLLAGGAMLAWLHPFPAAEGIGATLLAAGLPRLWPDNTTDAIRTRQLANVIAHAAATRRPADLARAADAAAQAATDLLLSTRPAAPDA